MSETTAEQARQTKARTGDVDAPFVQFDSLGREVIDYDGENRLTAALDGERYEGDGLFITDVDGDRVWVSNTVLVRMLPALTIYAAHRSFIAPEAKPDGQLVATAPIQSAESGGLT